MKSFLLKKGCLAVSGALLMSGIFSAQAIAQQEGFDEPDFEAHRARMEERRAEFLENNPEAAARMEERRREREEFRTNNPDIAARRDERRSQQRAERGERGPRFEGGEGRPRREPGFERRREGPPPEFGRGPGDRRGPARKSGTEADD